MAFVLTNSHLGIFLGYVEESAHPIWSSDDGYKPAAAVAFCNPEQAHQFASHYLPELSFRVVSVHADIQVPDSHEEFVTPEACAAAGIGTWISVDVIPGQRMN